MKRILCILFLLGLTSIAGAAETDIQYLSGHGKDDPVPWDFFCTAGQRANQWSTIGVPSNWELQGFGIYTYGTERHPNGWPAVQGRYKRHFDIPSAWAGKKVFLVFEGVMTDTQVWINGQSAGAKHQGGYYRFRYDVTGLLQFGRDNLLEASVDDESADASINRAERRGDYWNYGGIFRPVYLEAAPPTSIDRVAIDAKADGTLRADIAIDDTAKGPQSGTGRWAIEAQVLDLQGQPAAAAVTQTFEITNRAVEVTAKVAAPRLWTAETPNLYQLELRLKDEQGAIIHSVRQRFGFRTVEVRNGGDDPGLFVNGRRIMLKGVDRHSFWPDSGRTLSEKISRDDIRLMKDMNMNAVRMSHYPPDPHFLDACDDMGMYVLDELPGWHAKYDTPIGHALVEAMVVRDVNHPSILFWDNGNEGGWNNDLNDDFAKFDPQKRGVLHPWELFRGVDTKHYPDWNLLGQKLAGQNVFFPTEMLHGLYDGGAGAGLEDYWNAMTRSKVSAGGFIWAFLDEDVKRTDKGGKIDSNGNQAPDGIVGPYREKEGSFYAIKQIWSPIVISKQKEAAGSGAYRVENHYDFLDAKECSFTWEWRKLRGVQEGGAGYSVVDGGPAFLWPPSDNPAAPTSIGPGKTGELTYALNKYPKTSLPPLYEAEAMTAKDPQGHELWTSVFPNANINRYRDLPKSPADLHWNVRVAKEDDDTMSVTAGELTLSFSKHSGLLIGAGRAGKTFSLINGPQVVALAPKPAAPARGAPRIAPAPPVPDSALASLTQTTDGGYLVITAAYTPGVYGTPPSPAGMKSITYRIGGNGWCVIDYAYSLTGTYDYYGVGFDYPEGNVKGLRYLGNGPATVYKNRLAGGTLDVWEKKYNDTVVGDPDNLAPGQTFDYPLFKGYYAGVRWLQLQTSEGSVTALVNQDDLFVQIFAPSVPPAGQIGQTGVAFPKKAISFLHAIPAMGSKFTGASASGPQGQPTAASGDYRGSISLYFGNLPE